MSPWSAIMLVHYYVIRRESLDLSWLAGMLTARLLYYALYRLGMVGRTGSRAGEV